MHGRVLLDTRVRRLDQSGNGVRVTIENGGGVGELRGDYCVIALPATTAREVRFDPPLPDPQMRAISSIKYGSTTRMLLQFSKAFWRQPRRPRAFGTDLPIGAVWDASEGQRGRGAVLSLLAGGRASSELRQLIADEGVSGVVERLRWLGPPSQLVAHRVVTWDDDPWARGGYAYFDPAFDPDLQPWLARPSGRILFAGEHTSMRWQGYMNGAVESGKRAAVEVRALVDGLEAASRRRLTYPR